MLAAYLHAKSLVAGARDWVTSKSNGQRRPGPDHIESIGPPAGSSSLLRLLCQSLQPREGVAKPDRILYVITLTNLESHNCCQPVGHPVPSIW